MIKFSIIMPVFLGDYPDSAPDKPKKFLRAVGSVLTQTYKNFELVIISDGCEETNKLVHAKYQKELQKGIIKLVKLERHPLFTGAVRQKGIDEATGDVFCNLDADDSFLPKHLWNISVAYDPTKYDWCYFNLYRKLDNLKGVEELIDAKPTTDSLCTANVIWKRGLDVTWNGCDGRQDNKAFNQQLIDKYPKCVKIYGCTYIIHHALIKRAV